MLWISAIFHKLPKIFCWLAVYLGWVIGTPNFTQWLAAWPFVQDISGSSYCPNTMSIHLIFGGLSNLSPCLIGEKHWNANIMLYSPFIVGVHGTYIHPLQVQNPLTPPSDDNRSWHPRRDVSLGSKASSIMSSREGFGGYRILGN